MNSIKKHLCLVFVCSTLIMNQIVGMDEGGSSSSSFSPGHRRANSASSSSSKYSPKVTIENLDSPTSSNLNDIDGDPSPIFPRKKTSPSARITLTSVESATSDHFFKDSKLYVTVAPNIQMPGGRGRDATWSESLSSPKYWMPVITGITAGTIQAILQAGANWVTQDTELLKLEREITLLSYTNKKNMLEATQKALDAKKDIVGIAQTKVEELLSKLNDGQELTEREHEILQRNLSLIQKLASIAGN